MATATPLARRLFGELFTLPKSRGINPRHSPSPRHGFPHCGGFAPGAPRRASALVSVPIWGLPLSRPLPVFGLAGHYPANYLIGRRPILGRVRGVPRTPFGGGGVPPPAPYRGLSPVSRGYPRPEGRLPTCYSAVRRERVNPPLPSLPWVSRTGIAVAPRRINGNSRGVTTPAGPPPFRWGGLGSTASKRPGHGGFAL